VGVLVDGLEVVDGGGVMRLSVASSGLRGLVVDFGDTGEPADAVVGLIQ
jgi:hypothetical protein